MSRRLAIIPARSGSKGLVDKNIKILDDMPLLAHTINAALESNVFDTIMVSTDSKLYADISVKHGAEVPFLRNSNTSHDNAKSIDVVKEVVNNYSELNKTFDIIALLQPTSPLRGANDIIQSIRLMKTKNAQTIISVCEVEHSPLITNQIPSDLSLENFLDSKIANTPRQLLPKYYRINGAIYLIKANYLKRADTFYTTKSYAYIMNKLNSVDIDDELDFEFAELLINKYKSV